MRVRCLNDSLGAFAAVAVVFGLMSAFVAIGGFVVSGIKSIELIYEKPSVDWALGLLKGSASARGRSSLDSQQQLSIEHSG